MEVHHPHLQNKPGKNIGHYFYEFLMLFLAVFCGFLAENFREHQVEKEKAEQYILSFYEDLKSDTSRLTNFIEFDNQKILAFANLYNCYDTISKNWKATSCLWEIVKKSMANRHFNAADRTLKQLSNAGGFRLLRKEDADSIISYETQFKALEDFQATVFQESQNNVRKSFDNIVDFKANARLVGTLNGMDTATIDGALPMLISTDRLLLNNYFNDLLLYSRVTLGHRNVLDRFRKKATSLIEFYKNKYQFE